MRIEPSSARSKSGALATTPRELRISHLVMTAMDKGKSLNNLLPFAIQGVKGIAGGDVTIKRQFNGVIYLIRIKKSIRIIYSSVCCLAILPLLL